MAWWDTFTSAISALPVVGKNFAGAKLSEEERKKEAELHATVKNALSELDKVGSNVPGFGIAKKTTKGTGDFLLKAAVGLNQKVLSPYVFRPISTAALLTDVNSPLYQKGKYEAGFQFSDITAAYNRSAKVSAFQALTKSDLTPIKLLSDVVLETGKIDLNKVDLWNDESIQQNYVDNAVGRWFTGIGDFIVGNKAIGIAGKAGKFGAIKAGKPLGLYTKQKTLDELGLDMENGIEFASSNGATGIQTISGNHMVTLAESKDWGTITDIVTKYSTNEKLIPIIHEASDARAVKDLILADKGDLTAMARLAETAPDKLFEVSETGAQLQGKFLKTGSSFIPEGPAVPRLKAAYDAAINNNKQFVKIRDAFFDENYNIKVGGKGYNPLEPAFGKAAFIKAGDTLRDLKQSARFREFDNLGEILETKIASGSGGIGVKFVKWAAIGAARQAELKPLGFVTFSGMRPTDGFVELNAFLNSLKVFRDGTAKIETSPNVWEKVADVRRRFENEFMAAQGGKEIKALESIDKQIGDIIAHKAGWYDEKEISAHFGDFRRKINAGISSVKQNGYGVDYDGVGIIPSPRTLRQLGESYRFTPWDNIEFQIEKSTSSGAKSAYLGSKSTAQAVFRDLNRLWTFDVLVRPMYVIKQSIGEPLVSATLSQGLNFIYQDLPWIVSGASLNTYRKVANKISNIKNHTERKAVNAAVRDKQAMLSKAEQIKTNAAVTVEELLSKSTSPVAKAQHLKAARKDLAAASALLDELELDLRAAVVPYGVTEAIPTLATLERRMAFIESRSQSKAVAAKLKEAKKAVSEYNRVIAKLATNKTVIRDAQAAVSKAYDDIDNIVKELKPALQAQADVWGKSAAFKKRWFSKENQTRIVNGQHVTIDSFTSELSPFSAAIREETSNARTSDLHLLGDLSVGATKSMIDRKVPNGRVSVSHPLYFQELEYIANRTMRQDPLMDLIFAEAPAAKLAEWSTSSAGIAYMKAFDVVDPKRYPAFIARRVELLHRTFPTIEVRAAISRGEVTSQQLQSMLGNHIDELYDIIPSNYNYGAANLGVGKYGELSNAVNNTAATVFRKMASFENPIRNAVFDRMAIDAVARRADILMKQGIEMTPARWNALRQAAGREALQEMEKTVYTIRRQNRLLHNARFAVAFPTAAVNAFYRYGRLAVKQPVRTTRLAYAYSGAFMNFGVDENGNPTDDLSKVTHLIIPGTKELKGVGYADEGIALSAKSVGFLLNTPSPSFITSLSVGKLMQTYPGTEDNIRKMLTVKGTEWYDVLWPYGTSSSVMRTFTPPYLNALLTAVRQPERKADYLASWGSIYNYHQMLHEMGIEKKFPSDEQIKKEVQSLWFAKFFASWGSPFGVPYKVEQNPMRLSINLYYKLVEKYTKQGKSNQDARDLAGDEMVSMLGTNFMVDRVSYNGASKNLSIPATYESYKRVFSDNDALVGQLAAIDPNDIKVVGLLTADLSRDPNEKSNNILAILSDPNLVLPGTSKNINEYKMTPQEVEAERIKQRTWDRYNLVKDALEAKITDGKTLRSHPELKAVLDQTVETHFKGQSQAWYDEYKLAESGDTAYKYARALTLITKDSEFMKARGNSEFWNDVQQFIKARHIFSAFYQTLPDYDPRKAAVKDTYNQWVEMTAKQWSPDVASIVKTYFSNDTLKMVL